MKKLIFLLLLVPLMAFAQDDSDSNSAATSDDAPAKTAPKKSDSKYEFTEGTNNLEGDEALLMKEAVANWKEACDKWQKQLRKDNDKVMNADCGKKSCTSEATSKVCSSTGTYKVRNKKD